MQCLHDDIRVVNLNSKKKPPKYIANGNQIEGNQYLIKKNKHKNLPLCKYSAIRLLILTGYRETNPNNHNWLNDATH